MSSSKPRSSEQVPRMLTNAYTCSTLTEWEQNRTEQVENRLIWNETGYRTDKIQEQESVWNGNRMHSVKHSLLMFLLLGTGQCTLYMYSLSTTETLLAL